MSAFAVNSYATSTPSNISPAPFAKQSVPASNTASTPSEVTQTAALAPAAPVKASEERAKLDAAVETINQFLKPIASSVQFSVDEESGRTLVKVVDTDTNNVLRQFPSKQALAISSELGKLQGLLLQDKA